MNVIEIVIEVKQMPHVFELIELKKNFGIQKRLDVLTPIGSKL